MQPYSRRSKVANTFITEEPISHRCSVVATIPCVPRKPHNQVAKDLAQPCVTLAITIKVGEVYQINSKII